MMAPSGAPIKNKAIQAADRVNFFWYSSIARRMLFKNSVYLSDRFFISPVWSVLRLLHWI
jgi:hypothetical protein